MKLLLSEFTEVFNFFDKQQRGFVSRDQLADVMRMLGRTPEEDELQVMLADFDVNGECDGVCRLLRLDGCFMQATAGSNSLSS